VTLHNAIKAITAGALVAGAMNLYAATEDGLGSTSGGTAAVSLDIVDLMVVSGIGDIGLGAYVGTGGLAGNDDMCVYRNGTGSYKVKLTSANQSGGAFRLNTGANYITYTVDWTDNGTAGTTAGVTSDVEETGQGGHATSQTCGGSPNANLAVSVAEAALQAAPTGSYTDTVTILVTPT